MHAADIIEITDAQDMERALAIRRVVFCDEQGVSREEEFDGRDADCRHYLAVAGGEAVGVARLRDAGGGEVKIERVAVLKAHRGNGFGQALMRRTIEDAAKSGAKTIAIHAQFHAEEFYRGLGFVTHGGMFEEAGIPHVRMVFTGTR